MFSLWARLVACWLLYFFLAFRVLRAPRKPISRYVSSSLPPPVSTLPDDAPNSGFVFRRL